MQKQQRKKPLPPGVVKKILPININLAQSLSNLKTTSRDRSRFLAELSGKADQVAKTATGQKQDGVISHVSKYFKSVNIVMAWELKIVSRALVVCRAVNSVCASSIKQYQ